MLCRIFTPAAFAECSHTQPVQFDRKERNMKFRFVAAALVAAVISVPAIAQEHVDPQPPPAEAIMADIASDRLAITAILQIQPQVPLGPRDVLRNYEQEMAAITQRTSMELAQIAETVRRGQISREQAEYYGGERYQIGMMQFQLLSTLHQTLENDTERAANAQRQQAHETVIVSPPFSPDDVTEDLIKYLNLTRAQIEAIQRHIAGERHETRQLVAQLTNNRRALITATVKGRFDGQQVRALAAEQSRIIEELIVANARLHTKVYKILTAGQQPKIDEVRMQAATSMKPSFTEW